MGYVEPYEGEEEEGEYIEGRESRSSSDGEEEEEHRADPLNASSVKLTLPHSVRVPETMQVISMAKLMQKKVISPYLMHGDGGADSAHGLPSLVHDRVRAKVYAPSKLQARPTSSGSRTGHVMVPKKSVTVASINRLARSKLPGIGEAEKERMEQKAGRKTKKKQAQSPYGPSYRWLEKEPVKQKKKKKAKKASSRSSSAAEQRDDN